MQSWAAQVGESTPFSGDPTDSDDFGKSGGKGQENSENTTNVTKCSYTIVRVLSRSIGGNFGLKSDEGHLGVALSNVTSNDNQPREYIVQGGPVDGKLIGSVRPASSKGWYYDFSQSSGANWTSPTEVVTLPITIIAKFQISFIHPSIVSTTVNDLNNKFSGTGYNYNKGPNSNTYVISFLGRIGINNFIPKSEGQSWKGIPWE